MNIFAIVLMLNIRQLSFLFDLTVMRRSEKRSSKMDSANNTSFALGLSTVRRRMSSAGRDREAGHRKARIKFAISFAVDCWPTKI